MKNKRIFRVVASALTALCIALPAVSLTACGTASCGGSSGYSTSQTVKADPGNTH